MHQLTENVKVLQKCVLYQQGKFLILKRAETAKTRPGCWDLPGGNVEWPKTDQNLQDSHLAELVREVKEEMDIKISETDLENCYLGSYFEAKKQLYTLIFGWMTELETEPKIKLSSEHTELAWISANQFDHYNFGFAGEKDGFIRKMVEQSFFMLDGCQHCGADCE